MKTLALAYSYGMRDVAHWSPSGSVKGSQARESGFGELISPLNTSNNYLSDQRLKNDLYQSSHTLNSNLLQFQQSLYHTSIQIEFASRVIDAATHAMRKLQSGN